MTTESTADGQITPDPSDTTENDSGNDGSDKVSKHSKAWERALFMLLFAFIGYWTFWAVVLLAIVQLIVTLVSREPNEDLRGFSRNMSEYLRQIASYLGFVSDEKPCPFAPFPRVDSED